MDIEFFRLYPYRHISMAMIHKMNITPTYYGHFEVVEMISTVAYMLNLPSTYRIHYVFHVSCLKNKLSEHLFHLPILPLVDSEGMCNLNLSQFWKEI